MLINLQSLIGRLFYGNAAHINQFAPQPTRNDDEDDADDGESDWQVIARRSVLAQPEVHAIKNNSEQVNGHVPNADGS